MQTLDLKKTLKHLYTPPADKVQLVDVPDLLFLRIDGAIEPDASPGISPAFQYATQAMYSAAYTLKFMLKQRPTDPIDYPVMALEGLWWVEDGQFDITKPGNWKYTLMIVQPDVVTLDDFATAKEKICKKKPEADVWAAVERLRLERFCEGLCVQVMHIGPYASEPATVARLEAFAQENGYRFDRRHHEIYLGDPRKADPEKLKTILRHPVEKA